MRSFIIYGSMALLSLFIIGFGGWTYRQSVYDDKVRKYFIEKTITPIKSLKDASNLSNRIVLVQGKIISDETFIGKNNKKVVLERYLEEIKNNNKWKTVKDSQIFKVSPFKIKDDNNNLVLVDPYDLDKTFLGKPEETISNENGKEIKKSLWEIEEGESVLILANIENKAGILVLSNPNIYKSIFDSMWNKEPFIITTFEKTEAAKKATELGKSVYFASIALFAAGIFFILSSISNIIRASKQVNKDLY